MEEKKCSNRERRREQRKDWSAPKLSEFGPLRRLTTGGSGNASEGEMGNAKPRP